MKRPLRAICGTEGATAALLLLILASTLGAQPAAPPPAKPTGPPPSQPATPPPAKPTTQAPAPAPAATAPPVGPATYVGSETCQGCHEEMFGKFATNPHHVVEIDKKRGWEGKACESCHGPGSRHAESLDAKDIRNPAKLAPAETDRVCLTCHLNQTTHAGRISSSHVKNQVSCVSCHVMHGAREELVARKPAAINQKCASCHVSVWASFQRPYRHKLPEAAMSCVDCHNPHGPPATTQARSVIDNKAGCFQCHGDKRGPFIYEHEPMRTDGCMACHEPHGSANPRMLTRNDTRVVCLECHADIGSPKPALGGVPPSFHDLRNPRYQTCAMCHSKIHGSNVDRTFLR